VRPCGRGGGPGGKDDLSTCPRSTGAAGRGVLPCATHKHPKVKNWLAKNPRVIMHFTPTSRSWMNMVEIFFGIITRQAIRHGTFHSVKDLETAIGTYIDGWNERAHPCTRTKGADEIISHAKPSPHQNKTYDPRH